MENGHLQWVFPLKMVIFHSFLYVYQRVMLLELLWIACGLVQWRCCHFQFAEVWLETFWPGLLKWLFSDINFDSDSDSDIINLIYHMFRYIWLYQEHNFDSDHGTPQVWWYNLDQQPQVYISNKIDSNWSSDSILFQAFSKPFPRFPVSSHVGAWQYVQLNLQRIFGAAAASFGL